MRKLLIDFKITTAIVLLPAMIGASAAIGGEIVNRDSPSNLAPAKIAEATPAPPAAVDTTPRQHVKHLRAHKNFDAFAPDDAPQSAQKPDANKASAQNGSSSGAQKNQTADNGSNATRPAPKPRANWISP